MEPASRDQVAAEDQERFIGNRKPDNAQNQQEKNGSVAVGCDPFEDRFHWSNYDISSSRVRGLKLGMPVDLGETPPAVKDAPRKSWTREEVEAFERAGLFVGQRYELVEGELINKMGQKKPHFMGTAQVVRV